MLLQIKINFHKNSAGRKIYLLTTYNISLCYISVCYILLPVI